MSRLRLKASGSFSTSYQPRLAPERRGLDKKQRDDTWRRAWSRASNKIERDMLLTRVWETMDYDAAERVTELIAVRVSGETEEPLSCLPDVWRFKLGQCISHKDQSLPSLVMGRVRTSKGREIYGVRSFMNVDPNRDRMILAASLVDVVPGSLPCYDCLLHRTGLCAGLPQ